MIKRLKNEAGYSLVEVMVSIMILAIAIIPMVGMFDAGLRAATTGSNYDKGRALAKKQLEITQSLSYSSVKNNFPNAPCTFDSSGLCEVTNLVDPDSEFSNFRYTISKQYVRISDTGTGFTEIDEDRGMMKVTVIVGWGGSTYNDSQYTASTLKTR